MYSEKEKQLIKHFGYEHMMNDKSVNPTMIYKMMAEYAFILDLKGKEVDSLRRCLKALSVCAPYRLSEEFDELIEF